MCLNIVWVFEVSVMIIDNDNKLMITIRIITIMMVVIFQSKVYLELWRRMKPKIMTIFIYWAYLGSSLKFGWLIITR